SDRLENLEAQRTELQDLIDDLSFNGQQRIDEAITPLLDAVQEDLNGLSDQLQQAIIDAGNAAISVGEYVEGEIERLDGLVTGLEGQLGEVQAAMDEILAGTLPAENVIEDEERVFITEERRERVNNLENEFAGLDEDGKVPLNRIRYAEEDDAES